MVMAKRASEARRSRIMTPALAPEAVALWPIRRAVTVTSPLTGR
jgi:hypothetical protein